MHSKNQRRHSSPSSSQAPLVPMKAKMSVSQSEVEPLQFRVPRDYPHSRFNKAPLAVYPPKGARAKACVSLPVVSLEKMPCFNRSEAAHFKVNSASPAVASSLSIPSSAPVSSSSSSTSSSSSSLKSPLVPSTSHKNQEKLINGRGPVTPRSTTPPSLTGRRPSPSRSPLDKRLTPSPSPQERKPSTSPSPSSLDRRSAVPPSPPDRKHPNGAKAGRHRRVSGRIFDPNKHCGVLDPESKKPCTRSLTCKTHSLTHRRAVPGRKKDFDFLLAEHKGRAKEKEAGQKKEAASGQSAPPTQSLEASSCVPPSCHNGKATPTIKLRLANPQIQRVSGGGGAVVLSSTPLQVPAPDAMPDGMRFWGDAHLSSDEGEAELAEEAEKPSCNYSLYHPHPISWCAFSSRLMGRGHYVFDRRWDRMRLALHCMVEKHVSAQMWRKVPLVADGMASASPNPADASPLSSPVVSLALSPPLDSVSMVAYSTPFSHNGAGVFCIRDPDPGPGSGPRTQPGKPGKSTRDAAARKRRPPPASDGGACRKNGSGYQPPPGPAHISNGTAALSVRAKPRGPGGPRDSDRYVSVELTLPQAMTGDHGAVSSHGPLAYGSAEGRKRKTSGSVVAAGGDRAGKVTKTKALDGIFRKSGTALLTSVSEASHRLPKVQH